ncbi:MAG: hypothetical protein AAGA54_12905 [Myxococcota bacterium]
MNLDDLIAAERSAPAQASAEQTRDVWSAVEHSLVPLAPPPGVPAAGPEASVLTKLGAALSTGVGKAVVAVTVVAGAATVASSTRKAPAPSPSVVVAPAPAPAPAHQVAAPPAPASAPTPVAPAATPAPVAGAQPELAPPPAPRRARKAVPSVNAEATAEASLPAELGLIRSAQAALRDGKPRQALERLNDHARAYAQGAFVEDREALRVLARCALPDTAATVRARAADRFRKRWPSSVFLGRIDTACK